MQTSQDLWQESRFTGIFTSFGEITPRPYDPEVFMWGATAIANASQNKSLNIGGAGWTKVAARMACIGEAIERFQAMPLQEDRFIYSSINNWPIDEPPIKPEQWALFHPEQYQQKDFPFVPFTNNTFCNWVCFRAFDTGLPFWVPEEMAYLFPRLERTHLETNCSTVDHDHRIHSIHSISASISTGLSAGHLGQPILLRGLQEVIERDGIMGAWWGNYPLEEWEASFVFSLFDKQITSRIIRPNLKYRFYRIDSPYSSNITIVTVEGIDIEGYCFSAGASCRESLKQSWLKAILESIQGKYFVRYLKNEINQGKAKPVIPEDFPDHALYYSLYPEKLPLTVLHNAKKMTNFVEFKQESLQILSDQLGSKHPILFRNITPKAVEETPWRVLKIVVPGLQPLHGNHKLAHLGGSLWRPRNLTDWAKIPPHPFA